jgi:hypothetical protein
MENDSSDSNSFTGVGIYWFFVRIGVRGIPLLVSEILLQSGHDYFVSVACHSLWKDIRISQMITIGTRASQLRNNDKILMVDGLVTVTDFKMNFREDIVTFTVTKEDGSVSKRWVEMSQIVNKVTS